MSGGDNCPDRPCDSGGEIKPPLVDEKAQRRFVKRWLANSVSDIVELPDPPRLERMRPAFRREAIIINFHR